MKQRNKETLGDALSVFLLIGTLMERIKLIKTDLLISVQSVTFAVYYIEQWHELWYNIPHMQTIIKQYTAGLDEAGRGPWAGPLYAACVVIPDNVKIDGLNDSKLLTEKKREDLYQKIVDQTYFCIASVSADFISKKGLRWACKEVFRQAIEGFQKKYIDTNIDINLLQIDGRDNFDFSIPSEYIIKGDQLVSAISAASILAKVSRDREMLRLHEKYPLYGFDEHKGYGTKQHQTMLELLGPCEIHRMNYEPVKRVMQRV